MKFLLNLPDKLHAEIKEKAWEQKKSMNQYVIDCIESFYKEEFEKQYAKNSGLTVERLKELGLRAEQCEDCDYENCLGWKMEFAITT